MSFLSQLSSFAGTLFANPTVQQFAGQALGSLIGGRGQAPPVAPRPPAAPQFGTVGGVGASGLGAAAGLQMTPAGLVETGVSMSQASRLIAGAGTFVDLAGKAATTYQRWKTLEGSGAFQVLDLEQPDDRAMAKLIFAKGVIPADSDLGLALIARGRKPTTVRVKMSDGRVFSIQAIRLIARRRTNYFTPAKLRDAARTVRATKRAYKVRNALLREAASLVTSTRAPAKRGKARR